MNVLLGTAGVELNGTTWNTLLAAHARAGDMDGAYATWADMLQNRVVPTGITMRMLAQAFQGNSRLVNELLEEAAQARQQLLTSQASNLSALPSTLKCQLLEHANSLSTNHTWVGISGGRISRGKP